VFHWYSVACNNLSAGGDQVDRERRQKHCWERHRPVSQFRRNGGQEDVDGGHRKATHADNDLGWYPGNEPGGEEGIRTTNNRQRQILNTDHDEAVSANGLHVDIHVPKEDAQTHEGEEDGEHKNTERRCFPNVER